jgi:hypothetical protein
MRLLLLLLLLSRFFMLLLHQHSLIFKLLPRLGRRPRISPLGWMLMLWLLRWVHGR